MSVQWGLRSRGLPSLDTSCPVVRLLYSSSASRSCFRLKMYAGLWSLIVDFYCFCYHGVFYIMYFSPNSAVLCIYRYYKHITTMMTLSNCSCTRVPSVRLNRFVHIDAYTSVISAYIITLYFYYYTRVIKNKRHRERCYAAGSPYYLYIKPGCASSINF